MNSFVKNIIRFSLFILVQVFVLDKIHPHDIGTMLDSLGIAIRAGHHCAMPVMDFYKVPATARASFAMYNTKEEIDVLMKGIESLIEVFG